MIELIGFGLVLGSIISLGAIGLTLVFGILRFGNFAHGELMTWGAYVTLFLITGPLAALGVSDTPFGALSIGPRLLLAFPLAMAAVAAIAIASDRVIFRRLRERGSSAILLSMAAFALSFILRMTISLIWGTDNLLYRPGTLRPALTLPLGLKLRPDQLLIMATTVVLVVALHAFLTRTRLGTAMRATADNPDLARVSGIDTERVVLATWAIGGALAGAAGILYGMDVQLNPGLGWNFLIPLFAATLLGTIGNMYGALIGGLTIGVVQQVSTLWLLPTYKPAVAFIILIAILLIRPRGIFGGRR